MQPRKRLLVQVACAALAFAVACASPPEPPDWLQGLSPRYPRDRYAVGVGAGPEPRRAADKAVASIGEQTEDQTEGAEVVDTWLDPETGVHWALAVLDLGRAVDRLRAELAQVEARIARAVAAADTDPPQDALVPLSRASGLLAERDSLRRRIRVLRGEPGKSDAAAERDAEALTAKLAAVKRALRIEIDAFEVDPKTREARDPLEETREALMQRVIAQGFGVDATETAWGNDAVWLRVESTTSIDRLQLHPNDQLVAVQWNASLRINDLSEGGDVVALLRQRGRATHLNEKEARRLATSDAGAFAAGALEQWLQARARGEAVAP